jgi:hypothetical protein
LIRIIKLVGIKEARRFLRRVATMFSPKSSDQELPGNNDNEPQSQIIVQVTAEV